MYKYDNELNFNKFNVWAIIIVITQLYVCDGRSFHDCVSLMLIFADPSPRTCPMSFHAGTPY